MIKIIDAKGLECPKPVILTKKGIEEIEEGVVKTIVDNEVAKNNLSKLATSMSLDYKVEQDADGNYEVSITKGKQTDLGLEKREEDVVVQKSEGAVIIIQSDLMGSGDPELGKILMKSLIYTVAETKPYPKAILFYNAGVKLTIKSSPVLDDLISLKEEGVEIISCGTCLDFFGLKDELGVGEISNMYSIYEKMCSTQNTKTIG
ncbi:MAG: sulfurtransferase-like selenium metabolism protein YedF [Gudongella sp.]|nr:sulfurtransferase-like selenium metabolism protein YedF [Gudongella sp.]